MHSTMFTKIAQAADNDLDAEVFILVELPDRMGDYPAAIVGWKRDEGLRTSRGVHMAVIPTNEDREAFFVDGTYFNTEHDDAVLAEVVRRVGNKLDLRFS